MKDTPWHEQLTPRLALSHQTGFTNWRYQTKNVLQFRWEPGRRTGYSGEGYEYIARFAEKKTGQGFEELARKYEFDPVRMKDASYTTRDWFEGRLAFPHGPGVKNPPRVRTQWSAADDLCTTVSDYARFVVSVMYNEKVSKPLDTAKLHGDDIPVPVLAPGNGRTKTARLWTYVRDDRPAGDTRAPAVWFAYSPDRKGDHPQQHLSGFTGTLQADGYAGFNRLYEGGRIQEAACWAYCPEKSVKAGG